LEARRKKFNACKWSLAITKVRAIRDSRFGVTGELEMPSNRGSEEREQLVEFSIIVPVFNRRAYLAAAMDSISRQTYQSYEVIVVDDGSTDETAGYVDSLDDLAFTIRQENSGVSVARNHGARIAKGKYLVFLDSDDVLLPWSLQCYSDVINLYRPSVISARTLEFEDQLPVVRDVEYRKPAVRVFDDYLANAEHYSFVGASCIIVESGVFARSKGFSSHMDAGEDYDFLLRVGLERPYVTIEEPVTVGYRVHAGNVSKELNGLVKGSTNLLARELAGVYPGGSRRAFARITIIGRVVRPVVVACLQQKRLKDAWHLYRRSFWMHVRALRLRFLLGVGFLLL
jgi:glycosyltransferase involved in cell wall biosynthesis